MTHPLVPLLAVHIADGVLARDWVIGGWVVAAGLMFWAAWRIRDEEIPRVALLTAAFFVASLVHVPMGPTSAHLLLNGLVGVVLGRRALLAIPIGLFLQAVLIGHGGLTSLGVNSCIMGLPALLAWGLFSCIRRLPWLRSPAFGTALVAGSTVIWVLSLVYSLTLLVANWGNTLEHPDIDLANHWTFAPLTLAAALLVGIMMAALQRRLRQTREFPLGLLIGEITVLATALLNCMALMWGGQENWDALAIAVFIVHLPIAVIEGVVLGFTLGFLVQVKPEMVHWREPEEAACVAESVS
ncbi:MAG TPA: CbiM family transporter [Gemmataceae bacterium]|nr:CbiM family transporter [Gemmataceae bacterium]